MDFKDDQITLKEVFKTFLTDTENKIMKKLYRMLKSMNFNLYF